MSLRGGKKYDIFVSSTFEDLKDERRTLQAHILKQGHSPVGMELFSAGNDDQWAIIKNVIDACDYYIVIIAGRYGSRTRTGISYTEREFRYARKSAQEDHGIRAFRRRLPLMADRKEGDR